MNNQTGSMPPTNPMDTQDQNLPDMSVQEPPVTMDELDAQSTTARTIMLEPSESKGLKKGASVKILVMGKVADINKDGGAILDINTVQPSIDNVKTGVLEKGSPMGDVSGAFKRMLGK